jgi:hypothetical protein
MYFAVLYTEQLCLYDFCITTNKNSFCKLYYCQLFQLYLLLKVKQMAVNTPAVSLHVAPLGRVLTGREPRA